MGPPLDKCFPLKEKPEAMATAAKMGKVQTFDAESSKKLIDAINNQKPVTDWEASVVDVVTTSDPDTPVHIFFSDKKRMCMIEVAKQAVWDKIADQAFGAGT